MKNNFFFRLLITNLSVITIVMILVIIIQNTLFFESYKKNIVVGHYNTLKYIQDIIDKEIKGLFVLSNTISYDRDLSYFKLSENPHEAYMAVQKLKNYFLINSFVNKIIISFYNDKYLYTSEGSYTKNNYINYNDNEYNKNINISAMIDGKIKPRIINTDNTILFSYKYPSYAMSSSGVLIYEVVKDNFKKLLKINYAGQENFNLVFDTEKNFLISSLEIKDDWIFDIESDLKNKNNEHNREKIFDIEGEKFLMQVSSSEITGLTYVSLISNNRALAPFYASRLSLIYSFALIYLISIILSLFVSKKNYNPFNNMKKILLKGSDGLGIQNEVLWMQNTLISMNQMIDEQKLAFKNNSINKLIQNKYTTLNMFISEMEQSGFYFPYSLFGFIILQFENDEDKNFILKQINLIDYDKLKIVQKDSMFTQQILFLYNTCLDEVSLNLLLKNTFEILKQDGRFNLTMCVGTSGDNISDVNDSLMEAFGALEYQFVIGKNKIIFYSDLKLDGDFERPLTAADLDTISFSIYSGDIKNITSTINNIIDTHNIRNLSLLNAKSLIYQIANRVLRTIDEILQKKALPLSLSSELHQQLYMGSIDEMMDSIYAVLKDIEPIIKKDNEQKSSKTVKMAQEIINSGFMNSGLSVQDIADDLEISLSYLSRVFKKHLSKTILEYITEKRIEMAKKLLKETNICIKEIMEKVGYFDLSSFTRKFKNMTGVTPGNYRKSFDF